MEPLVDVGNFKRILSDDALFSETLLKIPSKPDSEGVVRLVPMRYNPMQLHFARNSGKRNIAVKGRQMGFSTGELSSNFRRIYVRPNIKGMLIAHKDDATSMLLDRVFGFHHNLPKPLQHELERESVREIRFKEFNSGMHIETAGAGVSGRSETLAFAHLSELAHWTRNVKELLAGISEAARYGRITIESTPKGNSGAFYELYHEAKEGENDYKPFFYQWWWDEGYSLPRGSEYALERDRGHLEYTDEEKMLIHKHNLTEDQIRWRRWAQSSLKELFVQEFPENDVDCWLAGGNTVFDIGGIRYQQLTNICNPIIDEPPVKIYRLPMGGLKYIMAIDFGKGLPQSDFTVAQVVDVIRNEQVATIRARVDGGRFAEIVRPIAENFNFATIVPEVNSGFADLFLKAMEDYPNMWINPKNNRIGWITSTGNKGSMIDTTAAAIKARDIIIHDANTLKELADMRDDGNSIKVSPGSHDDAAVALMISQVIKTFHPVVIKRAPVIRYR